MWGNPHRKQTYCQNILAQLLLKRRESSEIKKHDTCCIDSPRKVSAEHLVRDIARYVSIFHNKNVAISGEQFDFLPSIFQIHLILYRDYRCRPQRVIEWSALRSAVVDGGRGCGLVVALTSASRVNWPDLGQGTRRSFSVLDVVGILTREQKKVLML